MVLEDLFLLLHFLPRPPIFLPVHIHFYLSKWWEDGSLHIAMVSAHLLGWYSTCACHWSGLRDVVTSLTLTKSILLTLHLLLYTSVYIKRYRSYSKHLYTPNFTLWTLHVQLYASNSTSLYTFTSTLSTLRFQLHTSNSLKFVSDNFHSLAFHSLPCLILFYRNISSLTQ